MNHPCASTSAPGFSKPAAPSRQRHPGSGRIRRPRRWSWFTATLVLSLGLATGGCRKVDQAEPDAAATPTSEAPIVIEARARPPVPGSPRLAQMAVFPAASGPLEVIDSQPADGAQGAAAGADEARIVLRFNHPVVPLAGHAQGAAGPTPATFEPDVAGKGHWLDTSTWIFEPEEALLGSTRYTVSVDPALRDVLGASLAEPFAFSFVTAAPTVRRSLPDNNASFVDAATIISVTFNQPMAAEGTAAAFSLADEAGERIAGRATLRDEGYTLVFEPAARLEPDRGYVARVAAGAPAATGQAQTQEERDFRFRVSPRPALLETLPADGAQDVRLGYSAVELRFSAPMDPEAVSVSLQPTLTRQVEWWDEEGRLLNVSGDWKASTAYTLTLAAGARSLHGETIDQSRQVRFTLAPMEPAFSLATHGPFGVYRAGAIQRMWLSAVNRDSAPLRLYRVPRGDLLALAAERNVWDYRPVDENLLRAWEVDTAGSLDTWRTVSTTLSADAGPLAPGAYLVDASQGDQSEKTVLLVTEVNLTLKATEDEVLVWATDLNSGEPVVDLPVSVFERGDELLAEGRTDDSGLLRADIQRKGDLWEQISAVSERDGEVVAAVGRAWNDGIGPWEFGLPFSSWRPGFAANLYADRPLYRPGQTVYFRGLLRQDDDLEYALPDAATTRIRLIVRDPNYETVLEQLHELSDFGTFAGQLELADAAPLGDYRLEAHLERKPPPALEQTAAADDSDDREDDSVGEAESSVLKPSSPPGEELFSFDGSFRVAAYRKPAYEVNVTTDRDRYLAGETIEVEAAAAYFFGGPVADASVTWRLMQDDYLFAPEVEGWWDFVDYDLRQDRSTVPQAAVISEGTGRTDKEGRFLVELPAELSETPLSQVFTIEVELEDLDNQVVSGRSSVVVDKAGLYVGLRPARYVGEAGDTSEIEILSLDPRGESLPEARVALSVFEREWFSVREKREDGRFYWSSSYTDTLVAEQVATTDDQGRGRMTWTPEVGGVHRIVATAEDAQGREARSATYQWVVDRGGPFVNWRQENNDRIELVADKRSYAPGETARVLVPAPFADSTGLLTIERGSVRDVRTLELPGNSETIEIPITADMAPNAFVSLVLVKGVDEDHPVPQLKLGYTNLNVNLDDRLFTLEVEAEREVYGPRDTARWQLQANDARGAPVEAELSVALVDRALLALAEDPAPSLVEAFYGQRPLSVETAASLTASIERLNQALAAEAKGGGGGLGQEPGGTVRRLFQDTAFWQADVRTDAQGRASVETTLPDNLTTWRLDVRGITAGEHLVGAGRGEIVATRPVLLQPVLPRFVVLGDNLQLEAVIHNGSPQAKMLEVGLATVGLAVLDEATHAVTIPAGGKAEVVWQVTVPEDGEGLSGPTAPDAFGEAIVSMSVSEADLDAADEPLDAIEIKLPAYAFLGAETVATAGEVEDRISERIVVPATAAGRRAQLTLELQPSLAAASLDGLDFLRSAPYDCTEQTVSSFLPNVATVETLARLGVERPELADALEREVQLALQRLYAYQLADGGWGGCARSEEANPWLSAYALLGLSLAEEAGHAVRAEVTESAVAYLEAYLNRQGDGASHLADRRAFVAWVLARRGRLDTSRAVRLWERRAELGLDGKAFLAMALGRLGDEQRPRIDGLLADLGAAAQLSATGASWHDEQLDRYAMASDTRTTAIVLQALARLDPENVHLSSGVRWLLVARSAEHWETTQETAWALLALSEVMAARDELDPAYDYAIELNGRPVGEGEVKAATVESSKRFSLDDDLAAGEQNTLTLIRRGAGRLYYSAQLRSFPTAAEAPALDGGIVLGRQYFRVDPKTYEPTDEAIDRVALGETVQVRLTIVSDRILHYVKLEDPLPAGFEAIDTSLATTSSAASAPELGDAEELDEPLAWWQRGWWRHWTHSQLRDDRVVLFADRLPRGTYEYSYLARASLAGDFHVMPAYVEQLYAPEVFGRSAGGVLSVER